MNFMQVRLIGFCDRFSFVEFKLTGFMSESVIRNEMPTISRLILQLQKTSSST